MCPSPLSFGVKVFSETARLGAIPVTARRCGKDYNVPGMNGVTITAGTRLIIPILPLHVSLVPNFLMVQSHPTERHFAADGSGSL